MEGITLLDVNKAKGIQAKNSNLLTILGLAKLPSQSKKEIMHNFFHFFM